MGRYIPPEAIEANPTTTFNQASGKGHPLGARARKLRSEGILTVRFELPFAVWCAHCPKPTLIGQGVRFNAAKKKIGHYYSSPIFSFRFTHAACGGAIELRTDPQHTAYVVVDGARKRDTGDDNNDNHETRAGAAKAAHDSLVPGGDALLRQLFKDPREAQEQRETAFANLEKTIEDRAALAAATRRIDELEDASAKDWDDPYARNAALRRAFRVGRKERERQAGVDEGIRERLGLGVELLPEIEEDARRARLVDFGTAPGEEEEMVGRGEVRVLARPLFESERKRDAVPVKKAGSKPRGLKSERAANQMKTSLVSEIVGNTRIARDPFLERKGRGVPAPVAPVLPGLKRKRSAAEKEQILEKPPEKVAAVLVDYDSE